MVVVLVESQEGFILELALEDVGKLVSGFGNSFRSVGNLVELLDDTTDDVVVFVFVEVSCDLESQDFSFLKGQN